MKWININEKQPKLDEPKLVLDQFGNIFIGFLRKEKEKLFFARKDNLLNDLFKTLVYYETNAKVLFWCNIPKFPKEFKE